MKLLPPVIRLPSSLLAGVAFSTLTHPPKVASAPALPAVFDRIVLPTGHRPASITVADLNHDHHPDLVVANFEDGTLTVLLGDGKDHFTPAPVSPFACGTSPNDIAVADLNGDGNLDLIVANTETPYITILLGDSRGGFVARPDPHSGPLSLEGCRGPNRVAAGDVNGDGYPDIVVSCAQNNRLIVFWGSRDGGFARSTENVQTGWSGLALADLNGDGKNEIIVSNGLLDDASKNQPGTLTIFTFK